MPICPPLWQLLPTVTACGPVVAIAGAVAGSMLAYVAIQLLLRFGASRLPRLGSLSIDLSVITFVAFVAGLTWAKTWLRYKGTIVLQGQTFTSGPRLRPSLSKRSWIGFKPALPAPAPGSALRQLDRRPPSRRNRPDDADGCPTRTGDGGALLLLRASRRAIRRQPHPSLGQAAGKRDASGDRSDSTKRERYSDKPIHLISPGISHQCKERTRGHERQGETLGL